MVWKNKSKEKYYLKNREEIIKKNNERLKRKKIENPIAFRLHKAELRKKQYQKEREKDLIRMFAYRNLRKEILKEKGYKCEDCGTNKGLEIHHIKYTKNKKDLRLLCRSCHLKEHRRLIKDKVLKKLGKKER